MDTSPPPRMMSSPPPRRDPRPRARRKRRWLRGLAWTFGTIGVLAAAGIATLVTFAPVGMIREQVIREVKVQTGRDLVVAGRTSLSVYPSLALTLGNVSLSAPPGMGGAPFVQMRRLDVRVPLLPLLSRKVTVEQLVLSEPVFELRVDQRGRRSWDFAALAGPPTIMVAQAPTRQGQGGGQSGGQSLPPELQEFLRNSSQGDGTGAAQGAAGGRRPTMPDIALGDLRIDDGTVRYRDDRSGLVEEIRSVNARVSLRSMTSPLEAKGDLALRGEKVDFDGRIGSPKALLEERPSRVALAIGSPRATARLDGMLSSVRGTTQIDGKIQVDTPSLRGLAGWLGTNATAGPGLGPLRLEGDIKSGPTWVALNNVKGRLDEISGSGNITVDLVGGRPSVKGDVRLGAVDLNPYLYGVAGGDAAASPPAGRAGAGAPGAASSVANPPVGPQVKGFERRSGWSEQPFDLGPLGIIDGDLRVSMASLVWREINVGATQLGIALKNRNLRATVEDIRLYGGQGRGLISVEPAGQAAAVGVNLTFDGVNGLPLLKDAAGFDWIDGKARIQIMVGGTGVHERGVMETLSGKAEFGFTDGAVIGFNLPQMIRGLSQGRLSGFSRLPTERTDFSEAGASFQIRNGIAETKDLRALSPLLRLTGAGTANLGQRQIDATLRPRLVGSLSGQGAAAGDLSGIELPVRIRGSWEKPSIGADIDSVLKNPGQAIDTIRELGRQVQQGGGDGVNRLLDRLFRTGRGAAGAAHRVADFSPRDAVLQTIVNRG